jgi:MFS family permease
MAGGAFLSGAAARHLAATIGTTRVVMLGLALEAAGAAATAMIVATTASPWAIAAALIPYGLGLGLASAQLTSTVLRDVPPSESGAGSAIQSTVRQLGAALGSAVGGTTLAAALNTAAAAGDSGPAAFAAATSIAIWAAVAVLVVGLALAWRLDRTVRRT